MQYDNNSQYYEFMPLNEEDYLFQASHQRNIGCSSLLEHKLTSSSQHEDICHRKAVISTTKKRKATEYPEENTTVMKIRMPRIPKSDQRRQYGVMFANVFNAGDRDFMGSYLDTFTRGDHMYVMKKVGKWTIDMQSARIIIDCHF